MKRLLWSLNGPGEFPSYGRPARFVRRILGLKEPLSDGSNAARRLSIAERLDEIFAHDRSRLNEVLPRDMGTPSYLGWGRMEAPVRAEPDLPTEAPIDPVLIERFPESQAEVSQGFQTAPAEAKEALGVPPDALTVQSIDLGAEEVIAQLEATHQQIEGQLKSRAEDHQKQLAEQCSVLEGLSDGLQDPQQMIRQDIPTELETEAKDPLSRSAQQMPGQADATLAELGEELRASRQRLLEETKEQLASMTWSSLQSLTEAVAEQPRNQSAQWHREQAQIDRRNADAAVQSIDLGAKEAIAQLQATHQQLEAELKSRAEDHQEQLAKLFSVIQGLSDGLQDLQQRIRKDIPTELDTGAKDLLGRSAQQLRGQADAAMAALAEELKASKQKFLEETKQQLAGMSQASLEPLTQAITEQARNQLTQWLQEQAQIARRNANAAAHSVDLAAKEAVAQLHFAHQEMQGSVMAHDRTRSERGGLIRDTQPESSAYGDEATTEAGPVRSGGGESQEPWLNPRLKPEAHGDVQRHRNLIFRTIAVGVVLSALAASVVLLRPYRGLIAESLRPYRARITEYFDDLKKLVRGESLQAEQPSQGKTKESTRRPRQMGGKLTTSRDSATRSGARVSMPSGQPALLPLQVQEFSNERRLVQPHSGPVVRLRNWGIEGRVDISGDLPEKQELPTYPPVALRNRVQGTVVLRAWVGKNGKVQNVEAVSGPSTLARAAVDAVRRWRYKPDYQAGGPTVAEKQVTVEFSIPAT